jgi:hypothetical protein
LEVSVVTTQTIGRAIGGVMAGVASYRLVPISPGLSFSPKAEAFFAGRSGNRATRYFWE